VYFKEKRKGLDTPIQAPTMVRGCPALVLAAGASSRLGQPKALVSIGPTTLVGLAVRRLLQAGCTPIIVVTRQSLQFEVMTKAVDATVVVNKKPEQGRTGSVQCGIMALMGDKGRMPRCVVIAPVDRPGWTANDARLLMGQVTTSTLAYEGRPGHPLFLHHPDVEAVLAAPPQTPLRDLITPQLVQGSCPHIGLNIDTPEDLDALLRLESVLLE
tara:strand:+ start:687 stop:1328 length:642 start_codon:yes stop_codon:yes gene_type:complete